MSLTHRLWLELNGAWVDVTGDWRRDVVSAWGFGIRGDGPSDNVAETGTFSFALNNAEDNSLGLLGYYSPDEPNCRAGFQIGAGVRLESLGAIVKTEFAGVLTEIEPEVGTEGSRRTYCRAVDYVDDLANTILSALPVETEITADELLAIVIAAVGSDPPGGVDLDVCSDVYPFALDNAVGQSALAEIQRICNSERGHFAIRGDGVARFLSRAARIFGAGGAAPDLTVTRPHGMRVYRTRERILNKIKVTSYPRAIDPEPVVLASLAATIPVSPGATVTVVTDYKNPANTEEKISATDVVVPLEAGRDYTGNAQETILVGVPSVASVVVPASVGTYTAGATGSISSLGDGNTGTGMGPAAAVVKHSVFMGAIPGAAPTAQAGSVIFSYNVQHNSAGSPDDFFVLYVYLRLNGVEVLVDVHSGQSGTSQLFPRTLAVPSPPGGGNWTVATLDACEFVWEWNLGGPTVLDPSLVEVSRAALHVAGVLLNDRTSYVAIATTAGAASATHLVTNNHPTETVHVWLQVRGRGLYKSGSISVELSDAASITRYRIVRDLALDAPYQASRDIAEAFAAYVLSQFKDEKSVAAPLKIVGDSDENEQALQKLDFNSLIRVVDPVTGLRSHFYVNYVSGEVDGEGIQTKTYETVPADEGTYFEIGVSEIGGPDGIAPY